MNRPNIILILIDDMGWRDLGCYGSTFYETLNLDRLAADGMRFTNAYASCPVCSPTRASIMSGKYPARVGITNYIPGKVDGKLLDVPYLHYLPLEEITVARALREGGYATWHVGKWHLGDEPFWPEKHGFDVNIGGCHFGCPAPPNYYFSPYHIPTLSDGPGGEYLTDRLTSEAIGLIRKRDRSKPFFLNLCHHTVHLPLMAPADLVAKYRQKAADLHLDEIDPIVDGEMTLTMPGDHRPAEGPVRRRLFQSDPVYAAMMENLDQNIGRVLDCVAAEGLADNTLVMFTSDNGGLAASTPADADIPTCNLPLSEGKGWAQEGGTRVCQIARWPGKIRPASVCQENVTSTDFYPTFLEAAGLPLRPTQHVDGASMLPLLKGNPSIDREAIFWHYPHYGNQGGMPASWVVSGRWKLIEYFEDSRLELFDLTDDVSETRNIAGNHPAIAKRLASLLAGWREDVEAKIPQPNPDWENWLASRVVPTVANNAFV